VNLISNHVHQPSLFPLLSVLESFHPFLKVAVIMSFVASICELV
jgi:hypothetical protein